MILKIYTNNSADNKLGKSLTLLTELNGTLTEQTSILNLQVRLVDISTSNINKMNYVYIDTVDRYYFITDIIVENNGVVVIKCKCDVLESFKSEIREQTVITKRQELYNNRYLFDDDFKIYSNPLNLIRKYGVSFGDHCTLLTYVGS